MTAPDRWDDWERYPREQRHIIIEWIARQVMRMASGFAVTLAVLAATQGLLP